MSRDQCLHAFWRLPLRWTRWARWTGWMRCTGLALLVSTIFSLTGCGAGDDSAPAPTVHPACVSMDARLSRVMDQQTAGRLQHVASILEHELDDASQRAVVALLLAVAHALPPGAAQQMPGALQDPRVATLLPLLSSLLAALPGDPKALPPKPARKTELSAISLMARTCLTRDLFALLRDVLRDTRSPDLVSAILVDVMNGAPQLRQVLNDGGGSTRQGFLLLLHNGLTSIAAPDFNPLPLVQTLDGLANPGKPGLIDALEGLLQVALLDDHGLPHGVHVQAARDFAGCMLASDPSMTALGLVYDVLLADAVTATELPEATSDTNGAMRGFLPIVADMTDVFVQDAVARDAWTQVLGLLLRPDLAVTALPEVVELLQPATVNDILALVNDLLNHPCPTPEGP